MRFMLQIFAHARIYALIRSYKTRPIKAQHLVNSNFVLIFQIYKLRRAPIVNHLCRRLAVACALTLITLASVFILGPAIGHAVVSELVGANPAPCRWNLHDGCGVGDDPGLWISVGAKPGVCCLVWLDSGSVDWQSSSNRACGRPTTSEKVKQARTFAELAREYECGKTLVGFLGPLDVAEVLLTFRFHEAIRRLRCRGSRYECLLSRQ